MAYGIGYGRRLPQDDPELVRRLSLRWLRAAEPHNRWTKTAKKCVEMLEGDQWTDEERAAMQEVRRSALTINRINPLWRLVMGYQSSNRLDTKFIPTSDSLSSEDVATVLNAIFKAESGRNGLKYTDSEVFADGITTGRGFWDTRLCFAENDFGQWKAEVVDPFEVYIDPDCANYDLDKGAAYVQRSSWVTLDHIGEQYGLEAEEAVEYLTSSSHKSSMFSYLGEAEISPKRFFGQYADEKDFSDWADVYHADFVDRQAKRLRVLDSQYRVTSIKPCFVDLETGERMPIPDEWMKPENQHKIQAALDHALVLNNPLKIVSRPVSRVRWTVTCADVLLYDGWSPYDHYTLTGFFPYFRRGRTRGMIEDMVDPQKEINKKRSILVDILNRNANSGWMYEEGTLDPDQEENLRKYGSSPGINVRWKRAPNGQSQQPGRIEPGGYPQGLDRLEDKSANDLHQISGINESAMGQLDRVQSGRAIEARQRQAVLSIQLYQDNFSRSKQIVGRKALSIFQHHYTEERVFRIMGEDSTPVQYEINKKAENGTNSTSRMNDITLGKYMVDVDEVPISATFKQGQFEETMMLLEKLGPIGVMLAQTSPELLIDQTSLPNKEGWKRGLLEATAMAQQGGAGGPPPAPGGGDPIMGQPTPEGFPS